MITVRRSDTGTYVLVHEPSQVVMVGEDLEATYARLLAHVGDHPSSAEATPAPTAAGRSRRAWLVGLGVLALLPFLWLSVLHYSLGRMIDELRSTGGAAQASPTAEVEALQTSLHELEQTVARLETELGRARKGEPPRHRPGRAKRPVDASLVPPSPPEDEPDDAPTDEAEASDDEDGTDDAEESP